MGNAGVGGWNDPQGRTDDAPRVVMFGPATAKQDQHRPELLACSVSSVSFEIPIRAPIDLACLPSHYGAHTGLSGV